MWPIRSGRAVSMPAPRDPSSSHAPLLFHSGLARQLPGDLVVHQGELPVVARPAVTQPAGSSFLVGEGTRPGTMLAEFRCAFLRVRVAWICGLMEPHVRIRRFLISSRFKMAGRYEDGGVWPPSGTGRATAMRRLAVLSILLAALAVAVPVASAQTESRLAVTATSDRCAGGGSGGGHPPGTARV